jgi:acyl-CoA synthetase (AMP-forming)/AMP-acid ligase II
MLYTSGTTGNPKGVRRKPPKPEQMQRGRKIGARLYGFGPDARAVMTGPMYHIAPNTFGLAIAALGDRLVLQPKFDPLQLLQMIEELAITTLNVVPTMFVRLQVATLASSRDACFRSRLWLQVATPRRSSVTFGSLCGVRSPSTAVRSSSNAL